MFKVLSFLLPTLFLLFFTFHPVLASDISLGIWHMSGSQMWRTSFPLNSGSVNGASELYYPQSGNYLTASYENRFSPSRLFRMEVGTSSNSFSGIGSDSDWNYSQSNNKWYYGTFNTGVRNNYISIDWHHIYNHVAVFYGYTYQVNQFHMTDGLYTIEDYNPVQQKLSNLDSMYTMSYQGPHIGLTMKYPLNSVLSSFISLSYSPVALAEGHGWWNLRNLDFTHTGRAQMISTELGLRFSIDKADSFIIGYRLQNNSISRGREDLNSSISWDKATDRQQGYYFKGSKQF